MAPNPRIDDLRKRLEREPGSRLFAQLAEELRKDGELEEAIRVCREGLQKHPAYPSARMTLGRALFDKGELESARNEFEGVLKGAPDNILASRLLGECLEGLGDIAGARARYQATLMLAPGDRQLGSRLESLEAGGARIQASAAAGPTPARTIEPEASPTEPPPIPVAAVDEPMELESPHERAPAPPVRAIGSVAAGSATDAEEPPPIPLSEAEEFFELEAAYEAPVPQEVAGPGGAREAAGAGLGASLDEVPSEEFEFDLEPSSSTMPVPLVRPDTLTAAEPVEAAPAELASSAGAVSAAASGVPGSGGEIASTTLAELYFAQGFRGKAAEVYRQLLEREPDNGEARSRLREIAPDEMGAGAAVPAVPGAGDVEARREGLRRTIQGLETLLGAVRRQPQ